MDVNFKHLYSQVELDVSTRETRPGREVDITVISKPNSYIGLMGIDQSVLLLRKGNDLDKTQVFNELDEFSRKQTLPQRYYGIDEWEDFAVCKSWIFQIREKNELKLTIFFVSFF